jgi:hypothetical protein
VCQPLADAVFQVYPAETLLDLAVFRPPFRIE